MKCVRVCPECDGRIDEDGDTIENGHCQECVNYSSNEPCSTCGYMPCDQSC
jgi:hypothetical protein